jgi:hypothetical protein
MEDVRSQRSLPPLSTVRLEPLTNPPYPESSSQPHFSSPTYLPNSHTLPPPLHSPFLSSSSSDLMIDQWFDGRSGSRGNPDPLRLHHRPDLPLPALPLSTERSPVDKENANQIPFPGGQDDPLSVLAYAGRLVDRAAGPLE